MNAQFAVLFLAVFSVISVIVLLVQWWCFRKLARQLKEGREVRSWLLDQARKNPMIRGSTDLEVVSHQIRWIAFSLISSVIFMAGCWTIWFIRGGMETTQLPPIKPVHVEIFVYGAGMFFTSFALGFWIAKRKGRNGPIWGPACAMFPFLLIVVILLPKRSENKT